MDTKQLEEIRETYKATAPNVPLDLLAEIERLQVAITKAESDNASLVQALLQSRYDNYDLTNELAEVRETANDLAALVMHFIRAFEAIRPQVGNGAQAAIDAVMAGVEIPQRKPAGTLAEFVEAEIEALFVDVAGMDDVEASPLEIFKAQQTMLSAWRRYVNGGE